MFSPDFTRGSTWLHMGNLFMGMLIFVAAQSFAASIVRSVEQAMDRLGTNLVMVSDQDATFAPDRTSSLDPQAYRLLVAQFGGTYDLAPVAQSFARVGNGAGLDRVVPVWIVPPEFFPVLRLQFRRGRPFTVLERDSGEPVCAVGAGLDELAGTLEPGARLTVAGEACRLTGVVERERIAHSLSTANALFLAASAVPGAGTGAITQIFLRKRDGELDAELPARIRAALAPTHDVARIEIWAASEYWEARRRVVLSLGALVLTIASVIVALAAISLASGLLLDVTLRRGEIGLRIALGATRESIFAMVTFESLAIVLCGGGAGIAAGAALTQFVLGPLAARSSVYDERITLGLDLGGLAVSLAVLLVAALGASLLPARSAARTEPSLALREL